MIRIYLQYSYGGFKTFFIEGVESELVNKEVTNSETYGFPLDALCYFQYGGAKIIYRFLDNGNLDLAVREIPSIHKDGDGRDIPCAVQFIGDSSDRQALDYMAIDIADDICRFHDFFSNLFRVKDGLRIDGNKLRLWINKHNVPFVCETPIKQIRNIVNVKNGVILFVPMSKKFGIDDVVTKNVSNELNLPLEQMKKAGCVISGRELFAMQCNSKITNGDFPREESNEVEDFSVDDDSFKKRKLWIIAGVATVLIIVYCIYSLISD